MRSMKIASFAMLLVLAFTPASLKLFAQSSTPATAATQLTPEQYLRSLFYRGDGEVMERDGKAIPMKKGASLGDGNALTTFPGLTRDETESVSFLKPGQTKFAPSLASLNQIAPR